MPTAKDYLCGYETPSQRRKRHNAVMPARKETPMTIQIEREARDCPHNDEVRANGASPGEFMKARATLDAIAEEIRLDVGLAPKIEP